MEFFEQIFILFKTVEYLIFLEFPKPFTDHKDSFRGLRSLVVIIINGIFCIFFCLNKKNKINFELKTCIIVLFLSSIFFFKTALTRSDSYHIRYGSGISFFLFFLNLFIFFFFKKNFFYFFVKKIIFNNSKVFYLIFIFVCLILFLPNAVKNFYYNNSIILNFNRLILKDDNFFLKYEDITFLNYYQSLSKEDKCIQVFTDYTSLPYLMKKPSCTKFFRPEIILKNFTEKKFLQEFKSKSPQFILYSSPISLMTLKNNMPETNKYIINNYEFYASFYQKWIIYKKK